jgi:hypothetical protein
LSHIFSLFSDDLTLYFLPKTVLGKGFQIFTFNSSFNIFFFADIVSIENTPRAKRNIFGELSRLYSKNIHGKKECLVSNITTEEGLNNSQTVFSITFTLLPHQILFFPIEYKELILNPELFTEMQIYTDEEEIR